MTIELGTKKPEKVGQAFPGFGGGELDTINRSGVGRTVALSVGECQYLSPLEPS